MLGVSRRRQALREIKKARQCGFVSDFDARLFADMVARKRCAGKQRMRRQNARDLP
jgi:hypothetical protein